MRLRHGIGLAAFCLFAGSRWLVDAEWPDPVPSSLAHSFALLLAGLGSLVLTLYRRDARIGWAVTMRLAAASVLLLAVPSILGQLAHAIRPETSVAAYALVPLCVVSIVTFMREEARSLMVPAMIGLAGALLILPWQMPSSITAAVSLAEVLLAILLTAAASVWMHTLLQGKHLARVLLVIAWSNAAGFALAGFAHGDRLAGWSTLGPELLRALVLDLPQLCLLVWLLQNLIPERFAARFFLVPFVTIVEGLVLLHGGFDFRTALGLVLLLFGAAALLVGRRDQALRLDLR